MKKEKVTLKQLADLLNYSISTISKALNDTIAVIIPDIKNDFFAKVLKGLEDAATENNYRIITGFSNESYDQEVAYLSSFKKESIDGFIITAARETQQLEKYDHFYDIIDQGIPLVMFDRVIEELECDKMINDDFLSGSRAVEALIKSGDRKIYMSSTMSALSVSK